MYALLWGLRVALCCCQSGNSYIFFSVHLRFLTEYKYMIDMKANFNTVFR
jgi:hypothetical protein